MDFIATKELFNEKKSDYKGFHQIKIKKRHIIVRL